MKILPFAIKTYSIGFKCQKKPPNPRPHQKTTKTKPVHTTAESYFVLPLHKRQSNQTTTKQQQQQNHPKNPTTQERRIVLG